MHQPLYLNLLSCNLCDLIDFVEHLMFDIAQALQVLQFIASVVEFWLYSKLKEAFSLFLVERLLHFSDWNPHSTVLH